MRTAGKVRPLAEAIGWRRSVTGPVVFTNGVFDLLHPGHVELLESARAEGAALVVGLNSDASVRRLKGEGRPVNDEHDRACVLAALASVDAVVLFSEDTPLSALGAVALRLRNDEVTETDERERNQRSAPLVEDGLFLVPKVIE